MTRITRHTPWISLASLALASPVSAHPEADAFDPSAFLDAPEVVDCTPETGEAARCYEFAVGDKPVDLAIGPFCPATLGEAGGIWDWDGEHAGLYRLDRAFLEMLDALGYRFFDDDGTVHVADVVTAQPEDDHACIDVSAEEGLVADCTLDRDAGRGRLHDHRDGRYRSDPSQPGRSRRNASRLRRRGRDARDGARHPLQ